jgi:hypothetical protein
MLTGQRMAAAQHNVVLGILEVVGVSGNIDLYRLNKCFCACSLGNRNIVQLIQ